MAYKKRFIRTFWYCKLLKESNLWRRKLIARTLASVQRRNHQTTILTLSPKHRSVRSKINLNCLYWPMWATQWALLIREPSSLIILNTMNLLPHSWTRALCSQQCVFLNSTGPWCWMFLFSSNCNTWVILFLVLQMLSSILNNETSGTNRPVS